MRKFSAAVIPLALAAVALVGCAPAAGSANSFGCTPSAEPGAATELVKTSGDLGDTPKIEMPALLTVKDIERDVPVQGHGEQVVADDQIVRMTLTYASSATGAAAPGFDRQLVLVKNLDALGKGAADAIMCARAGDRVVFTLPAADIDPQTAQQLGVTKDTGLVGVVDLLDVLPSKATGNAVFNAANGLPAVVRAPDGQPGVVVPKAEAPKEPIVETLIKGHGEKIDTKAQEGLYLHYTQVRWSDNGVVKSTWEEGAPLASTFDQLPEGMKDALDGKTVGSQVMLVAPDGAGDAAVYVVDVLGAASAQ